MSKRINNQAARDLLCAAAARSDLQHSHPEHQLLEDRQTFILVPTAATAAVPVVLQWLWVDSAAAATVCLDVPDWLVDPKDLLFHSPVVAVGVAGLALILFPKLIRVRRLYNSHMLWEFLKSHVTIPLSVDHSKSGVFATASEHRPPA